MDVVLLGEENRNGKNNYHIIVWKTVYWENWDRSWYAL